MSIEYRRPIYLKAALSLALLATRALAQDSNVQTCIAGASWLVNSKGQTPCLLASYLESTCTVMQVNAIPEGTHYLGPQSPEEANACLCNSIVYSLVSGCAACQGRRWASWPQWITNCSSTTGNPFPNAIPPAAQLPEWAFMDVMNQADRSWNATLAQSLTQPAPTPTPTTAGTTPTVTKPPPTTTPSPSASSASTGSGKSNTGAIAGGVVGGVVGLVAIGLLALWLFLRKRRNAVPKDFVVDTKPNQVPNMHNRADSQAAMLQSNYGPSPPPISSSLTPSLWNAPQGNNGSPTPAGYYQDQAQSLNPSMTGSSVPMSIPMSPNSAVYTTLPSRRSFESHTVSQTSHGQFGSLVSGPPRNGGGYTGAAELS
ncbi:hypothetical protein D9611_004847 [Ephemerocybe angulata]|uniref:Transmembrane protein n=1 Tax=Ephemerocybe angulata TaxID=980116 RepID=A0A8H5B3R6_9AGAR|nr:hypothetical protein D9611_004847 [Tulosesus angulatus]